MRPASALVVALILLAGCSTEEEHGGFGDQPAPVAPSTGIAPIPHEDPAQAVRVSALTGFRFDPTRLEIVAGRTTEFELVNRDSQDHAFVISELAVVMLAGAGQSVASTVAIDPKNTGEFAYFCSISGHRDSGMEGLITVR